jgi:hypothetical protein
VCCKVRIASIVGIGDDRREKAAKELARNQ